MSTSTTDTKTTAAPPKRLYKSSYPNLNIIFPNGSVAQFRGGIYITAMPYEIEYFDAQVAQNGFAGNVYIDPNARTITEEQENPMLALRKKLFAEFEAQRLAQIDPANDMGSSDQGKFNPASTSDIAPVALGGDGASSVRAAVAARAASPAASK